MCAAAHELPLLSGPALGASPVLDGAESWHWEVQLAALFDAPYPDLTRHDGAEQRLAVQLPEDRQWTSVLTLTEQHVIGTMTALTPSTEQFLGITLPSVASSELVVVRRDSGALVFRAPVTDDATSTVTVGPDGALYVTQLALVHALSVDTRPVGGLIRFRPRVTGR